MKKKELIKYPINKVCVQVPRQIKKGVWKAHSVLGSGSFMDIGYANHNSEESCWVVCMAFNKRWGYTKKKAIKIAKYFEDGKKEKKAKKGKKGKNNKRKSKSKSG